MKILFNNPVMLKNTTGQNSRNTNTCQPELRKLDKDTVQFSGNKVSQKVLNDVISSIKSVPENSKAKIFLDDIEKIVKADWLSDNLEQHSQIYAREVEKDHLDKVLKVLNLVIDDTQDNLIKSFLTSYKDILGTGPINRK